MVWYGKAAGVVLGFAAGFGLPGALVGGIAGHMADQLIEGGLISRRVKRFLVNNQEQDKNEIQALSNCTAALVVVRNNLSSPLAETPAFQRFFLNTGISLFGVAPERSPVVEGLFTRYSDSPGSKEEEGFIPGLKRNLSEEEKEKILLLYSMAAEFLRMGKSEKRNRVKQLAEAIGCSVKKEDSEAASKIELDRAYRIFGLTPPADMRSVKKAYRALAARFHPDVSDGLTAEQRGMLEETFKTIRSAYETILRDVEIPRRG